MSATTSNEYRLKAGGILAAIKSLTLFRLRPGFLLFATAEEVSKSLHAKDITLKQTLASINQASVFYRRQRIKEAFNRLFEDTRFKWYG